MKKISFLLFASLGMAIALPLLSFDHSPACYRQMQTNFFRSDLVATALSLYNIQQSFWILIYQDLQANVPNIPAIVQARARATNPNPLDPVFQPGPAINILQQSLYEVYKNVMLRYAASTTTNVIDLNTINGSFNYLWQQQSPFLMSCMH